jgi:hypothetical protein
VRALVDVVLLRENAQDHRAPAHGLSAQGIFKEHSGNIQGTFGKHSGNIRGTLGQFRGAHRAFCGQRASQSRRFDFSEIWIAKLLLLGVAPVLPIQS